MDGQATQKMKLETTSSGTKSWITEYIAMESHEKEIGHLGDIK